MARIKFYNKETEQWEYADAAFSGGQSAADHYDLVIDYDDSNYDGMHSASQFTFQTADVIHTINKLRAGETVNCVLRAKYWPHSGDMVYASIPAAEAYAYRKDTVLAVIFHYKQLDDSTMRMRLMELLFRVSGDGAVTLIDGSSRFVYDFTPSGLQSFTNA